MDAAAQTEITECGQTFRGSGVLQNDLHCPDQAPAVRIERGELQMNGFTIESEGGVGCDGPCSIIGPGSIVAGTVATAIFGETRVRVEGVQVDGGLYGAFANKRLDVSDSTFTGARYCLWSSGAVALQNVEVSNCSWGVRGRRITLSDSQVTGIDGNGLDAFAGIIATDSSVTGNCVNVGYSSTCRDLNSVLRPRTMNVACDHSGKNQSDMTWGVCALD